MTVPERQLQPFIAAENLKSAYHSYITTSFPLRRPELRAEFDRLVMEQGLLWQEPYVSLSRNPKPGRGFADLVAEGVISRELTERVHFGFEQLHDHQSRAIERLSTLTAGRSTVISTSTGSGKTEAFLVPIIDHCLRHPGEGVKALILYPMNALANDQLKRLRRLLRDTPDVSFGRFTGEAPQSAERAEKEGQPLRPADAPGGERYYREEMLAHPPNILLTNHTMLELLLTRKDERTALFTHAPLQFVVIDEVHTFQGIPGTEVACLLRRLKQHVGVERGQLICIGTSATLQSEGDTAGLVAFASTLFGEPFGGDAVVVEEPAPVADATYAPEPPHAMITGDLVEGDVGDPERLRGLATALFGLPFDRFSDEELPYALYDAVARHPLLIEIERRLAVPRPVSSLTDMLRELPGRAQLAEDVLRNEAAAILLVGAAALRRRPEGEPSEPRFRPKVHLIMRSLSQLHRCLDPNCGILLPDGRHECGPCPAHGVGRAALPLAVCRTCGQDYWIGRVDLGVPVERKKGAFARALDRLLHQALSPEIEGASGFDLVVLQPVPPIVEASMANASSEATEEADRAENIEGEDEDGTPGDEADGTGVGDPGSARSGATGDGTVTTLPVLVCSACRTLRPASTPDCPRPSCQGAPAIAARAFLGGTRCPVCRSTGKGNSAQIITPLRSGASSSIAVLATALFDELSPEERRTLIFADSRQDTAHQAGFLRERHHSFARRQLACSTLRAEGRPMTIEELAPRVLNHTIEERGELEAYNLLIPLDSRQVTEEGFFQSGMIPTSRDRRRTEQRLRWSLFLEFSALAQQRNSLEREGLAGVTYSRLADLVDQATPAFSRLDYPLVRQQVEELLTAILDVMRYSKAVDYDPFTQYLSQRAPSVAEGEALATRFTRIPVGFSRRRARRPRYEIKAWYNEKGTRTAIDDVISRVYPQASVEQRHALIDTAVAELVRARFINETRIGEERERGASTTPAFLVDRDRVEVVAVDAMWRCDNCGRARLAPLLGADGHQICLGYRCRGIPRPVSADPSSYYVQLYAEQEPKPMLAVEHSGQLPGALRERIEQQFNRQGVNVLVCTPTLELGVDLPDLVALVMLNIPPTPANYAQRAGRAGRERRIALVLSHAGQGPHDSYFFSEPAEMITGVIRPPVILLDNDVVVRRHLNSLILENLGTEIPTSWSEIADDAGEFRSDIEARLSRELDDETRRHVVQSATRAFADDGLGWLTPEEINRVVDGFPKAISSGLNTWCQEYQQLALEHDRIKASRRFNSAEEHRLLGQLIGRMVTMRHDRDYYPLSFLARVGVLPRYGFPGSTIRVMDDRQQAISQIAAVGITEYAPGNRVYVAGRKLTVNRLLFAGGAKEDPHEHTTAYAHCDTCSFMTSNALATSCPNCSEDDGSAPRSLRRNHYVEYVAAQALSGDHITDEDEYRDRTHYATATVLEDMTPGIDARLHEEVVTHVGPWQLRRSRRRHIHIFNRGLISDGARGFTVCLVCGTYRSAGQLRSDALRPAPLRGSATGHAEFCHVAGWPLPRDDPAENPFPEVVRNLHLHVAVEGDILEIPLPLPIATEYLSGDYRWVVSMAQAIKLGLQLEMFVGPRSIGNFVAIDRPLGAAEGAAARLIFYDTLPGGSGYLRRLHERFPDIAARAHDHLTACECESACYRCLKEYWNQREHALLDKQLILPTLAMMAQTATTRPQPALSQRERFDSFVEAELFRQLELAGIRRPEFGDKNILRAVDGRGIIQMDFSWSGERLLVLLDGREFHSMDSAQILADQDKRNEALAAGWRVLEYTAWEMLNAPEGVVAEIKRALEVPPVLATVEVTGQLPSELSALRAGGFAGSGVLRADSVTVTALAVRDDGTAAVIAVDADRWIADPTAWRRQLAAMRRLTLAGVGCYRVPTERLQDADALADTLRRAGLL